MAEDFPTMWIPLYDRWTFETALDPHTVAQRLADNIQPQQSFMDELKAAFAPRLRRKLFRGKADLRGFKIWRTITYRNSFLPILTGRVEPSLTGSRVDVTFRMAASVWVFFAIWLGFVAATAGGFLHGRLYKQALFPLGMLVFAGGLSIACFEPERRKARRLLGELLSPR